VVVDTKFVSSPRRHEAPYFEITVAVDHEPDAARTRLTTTDETIYTRALALEGLDTRVALAWHVEAGHLVLESLT